MKINWSDIQNKFITAVDDIYINMVGTTATLNETKLNETISALDTDTTYTAGSNLTLTDTVFSLDTTNVLVWLNGLFYNTTQIDDFDFINETYANDTYVIAQAHFNISTTNITCVNSDCDWYFNATDSCEYHPSGGLTCSS